MPAISTETTPMNRLKAAKIRSLRILDDFRICVWFADGLVSELDFRPYLEMRESPAMKDLRSSEYFASVSLDHGALTWPNGLDIDPCVVRTWAEQGWIA